MVNVATDVTKLLKINIKSRFDSHTDQYNRIFMVKLLLVCSIIMGISWYSDSINCIVPDSHKIDEKFVSSACWIQGVYVFKELQDKQEMVAYYGLPKRMSDDGLYGNRYFCSIEEEDKYKMLSNRKCVAMKKTFYLQYQWMQFLTAALAILYYLPYVFQRTVNSEFLTLTKSIKEESPDATKIAQYYFNETSRTVGCCGTFLKVLLNLLIKMMYIVVNAFIFYALNYLFNGDFYYYGTQWLKWMRHNNTIAYDYMGLRDFPKPGNELLPPFGYCELYEVAKEKVERRANQHKFICEMSQNVLYQYCLIVLWFAILLGIVLSVIGFLFLLMHYLFGICIRQKYQFKKKLYGIALTFRELEYLDFIRKKNVVLYGEVLIKLRELRK